MAHHPERKEKDCLNCGTIVHGRYCHVCGQENIEPEETFGSVAKEFVYDIFHFDSKFFDTLKYLLFRPGFISKEYVQGKRARYLNPIRIYLFTSAFFFLVFFYIINPVATPKGQSPITLTKEDRLNIAKDIKEQLKAHPSDTSLQRTLAIITDSTRTVQYKDVEHIINAPVTYTTNGKNYTTIEEYDSLQKSLPSLQRDSWIKQKRY